jgi:hypothetical protein
MKVIVLESGLYAHIYTDKERQKTWDELSQDITPLATKECCYTPKDNLPYYWLSDTEISHEKYECVLSANCKEIKVKYTVLDQHERIHKAVRKAYK